MAADPAKCWQHGDGCTWDMPGVPHLSDAEVAERRRTESKAVNRRLSKSDRKFVAGVEAELERLRRGLTHPDRDNVL